MGYKYKPTTQTTSRLLPANKKCKLGMGGNKYAKLVEKRDRRKLCEVCRKYRPSGIRFTGKKKENKG